MLMVRSFVLTALLFTGGVAHAATILLVDVSDPMAVVFTPTAALAENTVLNADSADGIALSSFFSENVGGLTDDLDSGAFNVFDSTAGTTRQPLSRIFVGDFGGITPLDLNFFASGSGTDFDMSFLDTETALTGLASHDLSALTGLPTLGTVGDVFAGGLASSNIIGQYQVVPEPSTVALMALGLVGLVAGRRSR
jgi:hypothetical protein